MDGRANSIFSFGGMTVPLQCIWGAIDRSRASCEQSGRHVAWITRDVVSLPKVIHQASIYRYTFYFSTSSYIQRNRFFNLPLIVHSTFHLFLITLVGIKTRWCFNEKKIHCSKLLLLTGKRTLKYYERLRRRHKNIKVDGKRNIHV